MSLTSAQTAQFLQWWFSKETFGIDMDKLISLTGLSACKHNWVQQLNSVKSGVDYVLAHEGNRDVYLLTRKCALKFLSSSRSPIAKATVNMLHANIGNLCPACNSNRFSAADEPQSSDSNIMKLTDADFERVEDDMAVVPAEIIRAARKLEKLVADRHAVRVRGAREVRVASGICDIVTNDHAIEVKNLVQWKHAQGQVRNYADDLLKAPSLHLFYTEQKTLERLRSLVNQRCQAYGIIVSYEFVQRID
jgi:hypothetical protein